MRRPPICRTILVALLATSLVAPGATTYHESSEFLTDNPAVTLINFDEDSDGNKTVSGVPIGTTYAAQGVEILEGGFFSELFEHPVSNPMGWNTDAVLGDFSRQFGARFLVPGVRAVGMHNVGMAGIPSGSLLEAFDSSDLLLGSVLSDADSLSLDFFGLTTTVDITRIRITVDQASGWGLDDLYFGAAGRGRPEPSPISDGSAVWLASLAWIGLAAAGRHCRR